VLPYDDGVIFGLCATEIILTPCPSPQKKQLEIF